MTGLSSSQVERGSSIEENKILVEKFLKAIDEGNPTALDEYVAEDYIWHGIGVGEVKGRENWKLVLGTFLQGFPDMKLNIHEVLGERDKVVYRYTWTGTHQNEFQGISPTGKQVTVEGVGISRVADNKLVEEWWINNVAGLMQQLSGN